MMRLSVGQGIDQYISQLQNLEFTATDSIGKAIYYGADIVADAIKANLEGLPTDEGYANDGQKLGGIKAIQKTGLIKGFGIAKQSNDRGYINVKVGFHGYNALKTKKFPNGQPNSMVARTIESGNSFTQKHPFVRPAVNATKDRAERKMAEIINEEIKKVMK